MNTQICVPRNAVSLAGESGDQVAPEKGDKVTLTIEGTVDRAEGELVYVNAETANGEPMGQPTSEVGPVPQPAEQGAALRNEWGARAT